MNITNCPKRGREHIVSVSFQRSKFCQVCKILKLIKKYEDSVLGGRIT